MAKALCRARVMANGNLQLRAEGYPLSQVPTFNLDFQTRNVDLTEVRSLIENHIEIYVHRGIVDLFIEAAAANGYIQGYAKPIFDHLELGTTLDLLLEHLQADTLILTGIAANICVLFTANDAYMRDYKLFVPSDCVASNTAEETEYSLLQMKNILKADVRDSAEIDLEAFKTANHGQVAASDALLATKAPN